MRNLLFVFAIAVLTACSSEKPMETEKDIFISALDTGFDATGKAKLKSSFRAIQFDKDFWNFFIRTHPKTSGILFISPLYDTTNNYVSLPDTSYNFYNVTIMTRFFLAKLLADSVNEREKEAQFGSAFFVITHDTTGIAANGKRIEEKLNDYRITPTVEKEFNLLKRILTKQDTAEHYIIVFKKNVADKIYKLYE